jgi:hypothetical protein
MRVRVVYIVLSRATVRYSLNCRDSFENYTNTQLP